MRDKYLLRIVNEIVSMIDSLRNFIYISMSIGITIYHIFNTFIIEDRPDM